MEQFHGLLDELGTGHGVLFRTVFAGRENPDLVFVDFLLLDIHRNGEVYGATPTGIGRAHCTGDEIWDTTGVMDHPRALSKGLRGSDLVDLLHGPTTKLRQFR